MKRRFVTKLLIAVCLLSFIVGGVALAQSGGAFELRGARFNSGGGSSTGGAFVLNGSAGQLDAGTLNGGDFTLYGGFWQPAGDQSLFLPVLVR